MEELKERKDLRIGCLKDDSLTGISSKCNIAENESKTELEKIILCPSENIPDFLHFCLICIHLAKDNFNPSLINEISEQRVKTSFKNKTRISYKGF